MMIQTISDTKRDPFAAALLKGDETLTIFSGGSCLKVWGAHPDLQIAWEWFELGLEDAEHCRIALKALHCLVAGLGKGAVSSFYPNGADAMTVSQRLTQSSLGVVS